MTKKIVSDVEVYSALKNYAGKSQFSHPKAIKNIELKSINQLHPAYRYTIKSFSERRKVTDHFEPYRNGPVDGAQNGTPPATWSIIVPTPPAFVDSSDEKLFNLTIPHTEVVKVCHKCNGRGKVKCSFCDGIGCTYCSSTGKRKCETCEKKCLLKWFKHLQVSWKTNCQTCFVNQIEDRLPNKLLKEAEGQQVLVERMRPKVAPVKEFIDENVAQASNGLFKYHLKSYEDKKTKIIEQWHEVVLLPIYEVEYSYKNKEIEKFLVYGDNHQVYFKKFPKKKFLFI